MRGSVWNVQHAVQLLVDLHDGCLVATAVAVVGCTKDRDNIVVVGPVVALHDQLVGSRNELEAIGVVVLLGHILSKRVASATRRDTPPCAVVGVTPQEVTHGALVWHLLHTIQCAHIVQCVDGW